MKRFEKHTLGRVTGQFWDGKYSSLLAALLLLPVVQAVVDGHPVLELCYWLAFVGMLACATATVGRGKHAFWVAATLGVPALIAVLTVPLTGINADHLLLWVSARTTVGLLLIGFLCVMILDDVGHSQRVMFDQVCGGLCVYLMIGFAWGLLYSALERLHTGSFALDLQRFGLADPFSAMRLNSVMTYFSFATLTTLGYGDISPTSPMARGLVWVEAVLGQIYLAVFVAKLVSQYLASGMMTITVGHSPEEAPPDPDQQPPPSIRADRDQTRQATNTPHMHRVKQDSSPRRLPQTAFLPRVPSSEFRPRDSARKDSHS